MDNRGVFSWLPRYTAFSERFARAAAELMNSGRRRAVLLDPFVGSGTSMLAAASLGISAIGVDLDPFAALLSRVRVATAVDPKRVRALLEEPRINHPAPTPFADVAHSIFRGSDLSFASSVIFAVKQALPEEGLRGWHALLDDPAGAYDSEAMALAAMCLAAHSSARLVKGSNPVWFRQAQTGEMRAPRRLSTETRRVSRKMINDLANLALSRPRASVRILNQDFRDSSPRDVSFDLVLTSPPYLNRLDSIINHMAPLALLSGMIPINIDSLRCAMIGTTKIVDKVRRPAEWGRTCQIVLDAIESHRSKASASYYFWTFYKYFKDIHQSLTNLKRAARRNATGAIVIQSSFYKNIPVATAKILIEMAESLDITARVARSEVVRAHLGTMSPRQAAYVPRKVLEETVVALDFN